MTFVFYSLKRIYFLARQARSKFERLMRPVLIKIYGWVKRDYSIVYSTLVRISRMVFSKFGKNYSHFAFTLLFRQDIVTWKPDVVHAHDGLALQCGAVSAKAAGAEFIYDSHELETHRNPPLTRNRRRQVKKLESRYLKKAFAVLTVSNQIADFLMNEYSLKRPIVIYNSPQKNPTLLPEKWQQSHRTDVRAEAGVKAGTLLLVYTGNLTINRGLEQTVEGIANYEKLRIDNPDLPVVHFSMVGEARGNMQKTITRIAAKHNIKHLVHFHPAVSPTAVVSFIATADIAVIPIIPITLSYQYAMPNKLFEAMMAGLPILGARLDEMSEFIGENRLGLCYRPGSVEEFTRVLIEMLSDIDSHKRSKSRQIQLENRFGWEIQEKKIVALYNQIDDKVRSKCSRK